MEQETVTSLTKLEVKKETAHRLKSLNYSNSYIANYLHIPESEVREFFKEK